MVSPCWIAASVSHAWCLLQMVGLIELAPDRLMERVVRCLSDLRSGLPSFVKYIWAELIFGFVSFCFDKYFVSIGVLNVGGKGVCKKSSFVARVIRTRSYKSVDSQQPQIVSTPSLCKPQLNLVIVSVSVTCSFVIVRVWLYIVSTNIVAHIALCWLILEVLNVSNAWQR